MNPHVRRMSCALALALPLVVTATAAAGLGPQGAAPGSNLVLDAVRLEPSTEHEEMSDPEHEESLEQEAEHEEMSEPEHEESLEQEAEHEESLEQESGDSHDDDASAGSRPRALVLGSFGLVNAGVVVSAALLRRRTPDHPKRRPTADVPAPTAS